MILSQWEIVKLSGVEMSNFDMSLMEQIEGWLQKAVISLKSTSVRYLSPPSLVMRFIYQIVYQMIWGSLVASERITGKKGQMIFDV